MMTQSFWKQNKRQNKKKIGIEAQDVQHGKISVKERTEKTEMRKHQPNMTLRLPKLIPWTEQIMKINSEVVLFATNSIPKYFFFFWVLHTYLNIHF